MFFDMENIIILWERAHRVIFRTQERHLKHLLSESTANLIYVLQTHQYECIFVCERDRQVNRLLFFLWNFNIRRNLSQKFTTYINTDET